MENNDLIIIKNKSKEIIWKKLKQEYIRNKEQIIKKVKWKDISG